MKNKSKTSFSPTQYKKDTIKIWNEIAPRYHKRWAKTDVGPFSSTSKLIKLSKIKKGDKVLDVACGTGVVTRKIKSKVGPKGWVLGTDFSTKAIKIAKKWNGHKNNLDFAILDAESMNFQKKFDVITCQYALFFFPNSKKVLLNLKRCLKKNGVIAITVHGEKDTVPFFSSILGAITKHIPSYIPPGAPQLDRFGNKQSLKDEVRKCGFKKIKVNEFNFRYSPGTFSEYWSNYLKYIAKPLKEKLSSLSYQKRKEIRDLAKKNTVKYTKKDGKIVFPWKVLILTAVNP